jgi:quinol-cytochrome oxidoreductase complex cytochrome b subunit
LKKKNKKQISKVQKTQKQNKRGKKGEKKESQKGKTLKNWTCPVHLHFFCSYFVFSFCFFVCFYFAFFFLFFPGKKQNKCKIKAKKMQIEKAKKHANGQVHVFP